MERNRLRRFISGQPQFYHKTNAEHHKAKLLTGPGPRRHSPSNPWFSALQATGNFILISSGLASTGREDDANNESIQCQRLSKDENENHPNKKLWLLGICSTKNSPISAGHIQ